jgi:hypothetical protein
VLDISDPLHPDGIGHHPLNNAKDIALSGGIAVVMESYSGLYLIDINDPENPFEVGFFEASNCSGNLNVAGNLVFCVMGSEIRREIRAALRSTATPRMTRLVAAYPNPFNPRTTIAFECPQDGEVQLVVFDPAGRRVTTLVHEALPTGPHVAVWNGRDFSGKLVATGLYLVQLKTPGGSDVLKVVLTK